MLEFDLPWLFWLAPLPLLVYFFVPAAKREDAAILVPFYNTIASLERHGGQIGARNWLRLVLLSLIWLAMLTAAAGPRWVGEPVRLSASARDLLVAVDLSDSMKTADMPMNNQRVDRLSVVKNVVGDFVERRTSDRLGLILFGTRAYLQTPLTFDRDTVNTFLQEALPGFAGPKTAIGDAIGLATKRLMDRPADGRVMILLTDGANTAGAISPLQAAELAAQANVKIYTIGVGAEQVTVKDWFGTRTVNPSADLDESTLMAIAEQTGGEYFRARDPEELESIYRQLDILEPQQQEDQAYRPIAALFYYPLALALLLSGLLAASSLKPLSSARADNAVSKPVGSRA